MKKLSITSGPLEALRHAAAQLPTTKPITESQRSALLLMLEDIETGCKKIEQVHQEWMDALDAVDASIFLHDKDFRILRCNKAYRQRAGLPFKQIIGRPYYEIFPKTGVPLPGCQRVMEKAEAAADVEEIQVGDTIYQSRAFSVYGEQGVCLYSVHVLQDIIERKRAETLLDGQKQVLEMIAVGATLPEVLTTLVRLIEAQSPGMLGTILLLDEDGVHIRHGAAPSLPAEFVAAVDGQPIGPCAGSCGTAAYRKEPVFVEDIATDPLWAAYKAAALPHGLHACWATPIFDVQRRVLGTFAMYFHQPGLPQPEHLRLIDIATYIAAVAISHHGKEEALRKSEARIRSVFEQANDGIYIISADNRYLDANARGLELLGYAREELLQMGVADVLATHEMARLAVEPQEMMRGVPHLAEWAHVRKDGSIFPGEVSARRLDDHSYLAIVRDLTERRRAEAALRASEAKFRAIIESSPVAMAVSDEYQNITFLNRKFIETFGYTLADIPTLAAWWPRAYPDPAYRQRVAQEWQAEVEKAQRDRTEIEPMEYKVTCGDGSVRNIRFSMAQMGASSLVIFYDITERKQAEVALNHANRALATLSAVNRNLVRATNEDELLQAICDAIVEQKGYRLAWVGYKQDDDAKSIRVMARAGHDAAYLDAAQISWGESERGMGPTGRAVRSGATQLCQDIANDPHYLPWREAALKRGYAASIGPPLLEADGTVFGILNVYAGEANAFTPTEIVLLEEMAGDLAFGVRSLHIRRERDLALEQSQQHLERLRNSLEDTVRAIATIIEIRDPYTAGHQARVADLAVALAKQLGLPEEQVHAIHLAGTMHDLGKIQIPAEILSKPGKITDIEYSLIKTHPQTGYDILKGIDFPWPIAQMVLQHHERMDGSGYPQGLKGDAILLEARILAVADVVEAISAHRPYRPGFGIDFALAEITKLRGIHFAPVVVDACLAVFREGHYTFES